jgi:hypothetical protein
LSWEYKAGKLRVHEIHWEINEVHEIRSEINEIILEYTKYFLMWEYTKYRERYEIHWEINEIHEILCEINEVHEIRSEVNEIQKIL